MRPFRCLLSTLTLAFLSAGGIKSQNTANGAAANQMVASATTVTFCDLLEHSEKFTNRIIRVQARYETDFEKAVIVSPSCPTPIPMMWVKFGDHWESRTTRSVRKTMSKMRWRVPLDVVFIGEFKSDGRYGHMDMYPLLIEVYKVEAATRLKDAAASPSS